MPRTRQSLLAIAFVASIGACSGRARAPTGTASVDRAEERASAASLGQPEAPAAPAAQPAARDDRVYWEGTSHGDLHVRWSERDLRATRGDSSFSLASALYDEFERDLAGLRADDDAVARAHKAAGEPPPAPSRCVRDTSVALLSVVGSIVSYREASTTSCGAEAHPDAETKFVSLAFSAGAAPKPIALSELFAPAVIRAALARDRLVRTALGKDAPASLEAMIAELAEAAPVVSANVCYAFPADLLGRFAFHHAQGARVALRLALAGAGPCRDNLTQLGLELPIPPGLAPALAQAADASHGVLMAGLAEQREQKSTFHFESTAR